MVDVEERRLALAAGQHDRQGHDHPRPRQWRDRVGRRRAGDRDVPAERRGEPLQLLRRRSVRAADPAVFTRRRRQRLPDTAQPVAVVAARRERHHLGCTSTATSGWPTTARCSASSTGTAPGWTAGPAGGRDPAQRARLPRASRRAHDRRAGTIYGFDAPNDASSALSKVNGSVHRAVPARGRRDGLGRPPWLVRRARAGAGAGRASSGSARRVFTASPLQRDGSLPGRRPAPNAPEGGSPDRQPVIPLRDRNPTRRTPVVTLSPHRGVLRGVRG